MPRRFLVGAVVTAMIATACSSGDATPTTSSSTTTVAPTTEATTTTTTLAQSTTTSTIPYAALDVSIEGDARLAAAVGDLYAWFGDRTLPPPDLPTGLISHFDDVYPTTGSASFTGELFSAEIEDMGTAGVVVVADEDVILVVDDLEADGEEDSGWRVVGAWLSQFGADPWFGEPVRHVFVIGTDARPGELEAHLRADSLHILSSNIVEGSGGILGIPRDLRVQASYGTDKYTHVNALVYTLECGRNSPSDCDNPNVGQDEMVDIARDFSGLPIEGWIVTGFLGFQRLVNAFGGVEVDVPVAMADPFAEAYLSAGLQRLFGADALAISRNRKQFGEIGDFVRSLHQGMVVVAALQDVVSQNITATPELLATLTEFTSTNLSLEDLLTMAAGAFLLDPDRVGNEVVPSSGGIQDGAYYAVFDDGSDAYFRDLDDGSLTPSDSWLTGRYGD